MAVSSGLSTTFALETLIHGSHTPATSSSSRLDSSPLVKILGRSFRHGRPLIHRSLRFSSLVSPRCEASSDFAATSSADSLRSSSLSALEQLKTSAADRMFSLSPLFCFFCGLIWCRSCNFSSSLRFNAVFMSAIIASIC